MGLIDLHTHSTASDGSLAPAELVQAAFEAGISTLALTDHDSTAGLDEAAAAAMACSIEFIRGIELSTSTEYGSVDILGYYIPKNSPELEAKLSWLRNARMERNAIILQKLESMGVHISLQELAELGGSAFGRPHIAMLMLQKGYVRHPREAFERYLGLGKPAYAPKTQLAPEEAVELLTTVKASVFIAHPMLIRAPWEWLVRFTEKLIPYGLSGIEVYHSEHDGRGVRNLIRLADKFNLLYGGGSDFHGFGKPHIKLATGKGNLQVPYFVLEKLKAHRLALGLAV